MNEHQLFEAVFAAVQAYGLENVDFPPVDLLESGIRKDGDWFYVPVARRPPYSSRAYPYYDHLNAIEAKVKADYGVDVLFVPARAA